MTDGNGDDDKQLNFEGSKKNVWVSFKISDQYERAVTKATLGNLFLQQQIEQARDDHAKLIARLNAMKEGAERATEQDASPRPKRSSPPAPAAFLLAFIAPKNSAQAFLGDLEEMFQKNAQQFGEQQARRMYWFEAARSVGPLVWQWVKRMGFITLLVDYVRSQFGI